MTRKDFEMISSTLKSLTRGRPDGWAQNGWRETCLTFSDALASTNPRFDRARFLAACGMEN
jgi:hypothetical protein